MAVDDEMMCPSVKSEDEAASHSHDGGMLRVLHKKRGERNRLVTQL